MHFQNVSRFFAFFCMIDMLWLIENDSKMCRSCAGSEVVMEDVWIVPKNIRQIGESHGSISVYIEDYAATFISQFAKNIGACAGTGVCYGKIYEEAERTNIVIEGVTVSSGRVENVEQIFTQEPYREAEKEGISYFPNQRMIGKVIVETQMQYVTDNRMPQMFTTTGLSAARVELVLQAGREEGIKGIWVASHGAVEKLENYYIYYDRNETMQSYLIRWNEQLRGAQQEREEQIREQEEVQSIISEKKQEPFPILECVACLILIVACVTGIVSINNYQSLQGVEESMQNLARDFYGEDETVSGPEYGQDGEYAGKQDEQEAVAEGTVTDLPLYTPESAWGENAVSGQADVETLNGETEDGVTGNLNEAGENEAGENETGENETGENEAAQDPERGENGQENLDQSDAESQADESIVTQTVSYQEYVVKPGDTLSSICYTFYQDRSKVDEVCRLNGITDPDVLAVGQKILLP